MKAVANITPVPKCFPIKKKMAGIRRNGIFFDKAGKETAWRIMNQILTRRSCSITHRREMQ